jgi:hypothetical protein
VGLLRRYAPRNDGIKKTLHLLQGIVESYRSRQTVWGGGPLVGATGIPIGNLTSQLFANVYLDAFDHFIKEELRVPFYLRYTDDAVILHKDPKYLSLLIPFIEQWLWQERRLELHPHKIKIRKLSQGIDFLGYVTLPYYRVLRTKTERRMMRRVNRTNISSYFGLLKHCEGHRLACWLVKITPAHP